jgi:excinuclease UvrABC ATPase subunit
VSGGGRQRLKLASENGKPSKIVLLDDPTTSLHTADVENLLALLNRALRSP